jgi:hypothetical protein
MLLETTVAVRMASALVRSQIRLWAGRRELPIAAKSVFV